MKKRLSLGAVPVAVLAACAIACTVEEPAPRFLVHFPAEGTLFVWAPGESWPASPPPDHEPECAAPAAGHARLTALVAEHNRGLPPDVAVLYTPGPDFPLMLPAGPASGTLGGSMVDETGGEVVVFTDFSGDVAPDGTARLTLRYRRYPIPTSASWQAGTDADGTKYVAAGDPVVPPAEWQRVPPSVGPYDLCQLTTTPHGTGSLTVHRPDATVLATATWRQVGAALVVRRQLADSELLAVTTTDRDAATLAIELSGGERAVEATVYAGDRETGEPPAVDGRVEEDGAAQCWRGLDFCEVSCP